MWSFDSDRELTTAAVTCCSSSTSTTSTPSRRARRHRRRRRKNKPVPAATSPRDATADVAPEPEPEAEDVWRGAQWESAWPGRQKKKNPVVVVTEGDADGGAAAGRSRSLTDDDVEELRGCADLGFGFSYDEIPELKSTLPALELCYSMMSQRLLDDSDRHPAPSEAVTNWKISSPGDSPDVVKARLKCWAQAVACTVRLCS